MSRARCASSRTTQIGRRFRRCELMGVNFEDFDPTSGATVVCGKGMKERSVYPTNAAGRSRRVAPSFRARESEAAPRRTGRRRLESEAVASDVTVNRRRHCADLALHHLEGVGSCGARSEEIGDACRPEVNFHRTEAATSGAFRGISRHPGGCSCCSPLRLVSWGLGASGEAVQVVKHADEDRAAAELLHDARNDHLTDAEVLPKVSEIGQRELAAEAHQ